MEGIDVIQEPIDSLLDSIEKAEREFKNHTISFESMEETLKELKMRLELVKMKEVLKKIGNKKAPKQNEGDKPKGLRQVLNQEKPIDESTTSNTAT